MQQVQGYKIAVDNKMDCYGQTDVEKKQIKINTKKGDVVNTIIHEKLHANYPKMSEHDVYANTEKIEKSMTLPEMAHELMDVHMRSTQPQHVREVVHTVASNIRETNIK